MIENNKIAQCIAALDAIKMECTDQQMILGKILAEQLGQSETDILNAIKHSSYEMMNKYIK